MAIARSNSRLSSRLDLCFFKNNLFRHWFCREVAYFWLYFRDELLFQFSARFRYTHVKPRVRLLPCRPPPKWIRFSSAAPAFLGKIWRTSRSSMTFNCSLTKIQPVSYYSSSCSVLDSSSSASFIIFSHFLMKTSTDYHTAGFRLQRTCRTMYVVVNRREVVCLTRCISNFPLHQTVWLRVHRSTNHKPPISFCISLSSVRVLALSEQLFWPPLWRWLSLHLKIGPFLSLNTLSWLARGMLPKHVAQKIRSLRVRITLGSPVCCEPQVCSPGDNTKTRFQIGNKKHDFALFISGSSLSGRVVARSVPMHNNVRPVKRAAVFPI